MQGDFIADSASHGLSFASENARASWAPPRPASPIARRSSKLDPSSSLAREGAGRDTEAVGGDEGISIAGLCSENACAKMTKKNRSNVGLAMLEIYRGYNIDGFLRERLGGRCCPAPLQNRAPRRKREAASSSSRAVNGVLTRAGVITPAAMWPAEGRKPYLVARRK